jgi:hypothetical protein
MRESPIPGTTDDGFPCTVGNTLWAASAAGTIFAVAEIAVSYRSRPRLSCPVAEVAEWTRSLPTGWWPSARQSAGGVSHSELGGEIAITGYEFRV